MVRLMGLPTLKTNSSHASSSPDPAQRQTTSFKDRYEYRVVLGVLDICHFWSEFVDRWPTQLLGKNESALLKKPRFEESRPPLANWMIGNNSVRKNSVIGLSTIRSFARAVTEVESSPLVASDPFH
jgi:hypothetical protein